MAGGVVSGDRMYTTPSCRSGKQHAPLEGISLINNEVVSITVQYLCILEPRQNGVTCYTTTCGPRVKLC